MAIRRDRRYDAYINALWAFTLCLSHLAFQSNGSLTDNRCYLENGGSSENFFISEDIEIGSILGQVRVHGDPRAGGTIALRLKETDSPISIAPGTKNLTLRRQLDKEGVKGPSSVYVNLICERLHTLDPGFVIPINIRVTDANDNSPIFINAPYVLNISEVTVVGTRVLQGVHAIDNDQQGPYSSVRYSVLPGPHSDYFQFENELEGTLVLRKPLDYETLRSFDVKIRAQDHGEPPKQTDTVLTVHVVDADDQNPRFQDDRYTCTLPTHNPRRGSILTVRPRAVKAFDQDLGINAPVYYTFNGIIESPLKIDRVNGQITLARDVTDDDFEHPATVVIRATQQDNTDRYALATLTVSRGGRNSSNNNGIRFLHGTYHIKASESLPIGSIIGVLTNNRPNLNLRYFVSDQNVLRTFILNTKGEMSLRKRLDYEERDGYVFKVFATDGITNDSTIVNITVDDVNEWEPRFRYPHYEYFVKGHPHELIGRIEAADGDKNDQLTLSLSGDDASLFFITPTGELRLRRQPLGGVGVVDLVVVATDSGTPPKKSTVPVTVHFPKGDGDAEMSTRGGNEKGAGALILAGFGGILLILAFVIALLIAYICKKKRSASGDRGESLPSLQAEKSQSTPAMTERMSNPMFANRNKSPTASALGGLITPSTTKSRIASPKVHPAPQPPQWPQSGSSSQRVKKLSWGDDNSTTDSTTDNIDTTPKLIDNTNLTVYF